MSAPKRSLRVIGWLPDCTRHRRPAAGEASAAAPSKHHRLRVVNRGYYNLYTKLYTPPYTCYNPYVKPESRTPNVRISPHAHELLRQLAEEEQASMQAVLDRAIERYRRESFLRAANNDFQALKGDPRADRKSVV